MLRVPNIASGRIDFGPMKFAPALEELRRLALQQGDVLICRTNGSLDLIGKAAVVPRLEKPHAFASYLIRLRLDARVLLPEYFHLVLMSPIGRAQIEDRARTTAGQFNLNLEILRNLAVPRPGLDEQKVIVRRITALLDLADRITRRADESSNRAERLKESILAKAFRGELVPTEAELAAKEERTFESAEELIVQIKNGTGNRRVSVGQLGAKTKGRKAKASW